MQLVPTNRPKSEQQQGWRDAWRWRSFAALRTDSQFAREARRQQLLDQRWRRWRSMIVTAIVSLGVVAGEIPLDRVVDALLKAVGIS